LETDPGAEAFQHTQYSVRNMKPFMAFAAGALLAVSLSPSAIAQPVAPLAYVQPVAPAAVQAVQDHLRRAGAYNGATDGVWGPDSSNALQQFQASHQLQVTGQLNQATAAALGLDPGILLGTQQASLPPPMPPPENLQPGSVRALQDRLRSLGFYTGGVDGVWGQSTERAVEQLQQNRGLQPTGQLTPATVSSMGLSPDSLAYR
jgi:peptidoglycan hydrolase-like protein with peptidoglycan-binding domain